MIEQPKNWKDDIRIHEPPIRGWCLRWVVWDEVRGEPDDCGTLVGEPYAVNGSVDHEMRVVHEAVAGIADTFDRTGRVFFWTTIRGAQKAKILAKKALKEYRDGTHS